MYIYAGKTLQTDQWTYNLYVPKTRPYDAERFETTFGDLDTHDFGMF